VVVDRKHLARTDAAIVVSTAQMDFLCEIVGHDRVFFVPHGIDVNYFSPAEKRLEQSDKFQCLFVGRHLRDLGTLANTAKLLASDKQFSFTVVTRQDKFDRFANLKNVTALANINDRQLLELYQQSDLLVLPLLDCTANNTLLEAMACGLPIVSTDLQGVRDYVSNESAILVPKGDARAFADVLVSLERDRHQLAAMAEASRPQAIIFRWESVAKRTWDVYRQVS